MEDINLLTKDDLIRVIALFYDKIDDLSIYNSKEELLKCIGNLALDQCYKKIGWQLSIQNNVDLD